METTNRINTKKMTTTALMTAVICILAPMSIHIGPIPLSFTNLAIYLAAYLIGTKGALTSYFLYYILGLFGLPVFSGFRGGIAVAVGPTGGFLIGFFVMALISGIFIEKFNNMAMHFIGMEIGTWIPYILGTIWYAFVAGVSLKAAFAACVLPFIGVDMVKMAAALFLGNAVKKRIYGINNIS